MMPSNGRSNNNQAGGAAQRRWQQQSYTNVYQPSIYRYTCRGAFFLSSEDKGSEGICRGLRSRLELLDDMEVNTREGAIKNFTYMTDYELDEGDASALNQQTKSILVSPALIYKEDADADGKTQGQPLPEEELIKRQKWSCYGSTEVEYLVLRNPKSGAEKIAAVAPRNVGVSVRRIEADDGSITSLGIGWLNIVVDSGPAFLDDEPANASPSASPSSSSPHATTDQHQDAQDRLPPAPGEEAPSKPPTDAIDSAKESLTKVYKFSLKLADQMQNNAAWLYGNFQEDFPARTVAAGNKIVASFPRTVDRTVKFMGKIWDRWWDDDGRPRE